MKINTKYDIGDIVIYLKNDNHISSFKINKIIAMTLKEGYGIDIIYVNKEGETINEKDIIEAQKRGGDGKRKI